MTGSDWTRAEVEAIVADYLAMLALELSGSPYSKAEHRRALAMKLTGRTEGSIEFKHANISAALIEEGFPYLDGYKPRSNFQGLLLDVVAREITNNSELLQIAAADADQPMPVPEVEEILGILTARPVGVAAEVILDHVAEVKVDHLGEDGGLWTADADSGAICGDTGVEPSRQVNQGNRARLRYFADDSAALSI